MCHVYDNGSVEVVGKRGFLLAQWFNSNGYLVVKLNNKAVPIHRIVASSIPNPEGLSDVNHKDGRKTNNHPSNLEWCSRSQNIRHSIDTGLHDNPDKPVVGVNVKTGDGVWFRSQAEAGRFGFTQPNISHCLGRRRKTCKGYTWEAA
jgi:hypothetical protein